jgi:hypothetical protein
MAGSNPSPLAKYKLVRDVGVLVTALWQGISTTLLSTSQTAAAVPRYHAENECWCSCWTIYRCS